MRVWLITLTLWIIAVVFGLLFFKGLSKGRDDDKR